MLGGKKLNIENGRFVAFLQIVTDCWSWSLIVGFRSENTFLANPGGRRIGLEAADTLNLALLYSSEIVMCVFVWLWSKHFSNYLSWVSLFWKALMEEGGGREGSGGRQAMPWIWRGAVGRKAGRIKGTAPPTNTNTSTSTNTNAVGQLEGRLSTPFHRPGACILPKPTLIGLNDFFSWRTLSMTN